MEEKKRWWENSFIIIATISIIVVYGSYIFNFHNQKISKSSEDWGTFGDFIGGTLNPTLAFLSLLAILQTIRIQSKELAKSSEALELSKEELAKSSEALTEQAKSLKLQNFENTFFNLLNLYNTTKNDLSKVNKLEILEHTDSKNNTFKFNVKKYQDALDNTNNGIERIGHMLYYFQLEFNSYPEEHFNKETIPKEIKDKYKKNQLSDTNKLYNEFHNKYARYLDPYIHTIYQILNFVDQSNYIENKNFYTNILRSQLNKFETVLIFNHSISSRGETLLPKIIKFEFLEYLPSNDLICMHTIKQYVEKTKELDKNFPPNKVFGNSTSYKRKVDRLINTSSQEPQ